MFDFVQLVTIIWEWKKNILKILIKLLIIINKVLNCLKIINKKMIFYMKNSKKHMKNVLIIIQIMMKKLENIRVLI